MAGQPFDPSLFEKVDPEEAGFMLAWNHVHRWQYFGWLNEELTMHYIQPGSSGRSQLSPGFSGVGHIDRYLDRYLSNVLSTRVPIAPRYAA